MKMGIKAEQDIQYLATFVHGVLAGLHALGMLYNLKRRNWIDVAAHSAAMTYDMWATARHMIALDRLTSAQGIVKRVWGLQPTGHDMAHE